MIQVLWEQGFIDPTKGIKEYTLNGRKDMFGNCILDTLGVYIIFYSYFVLIPKYYSTVGT